MARTLGITLAEGVTQKQVEKILAGLGEVRDVTSEVEVARTAANLTSWDELCAAKAVQDFGLTDPDEIGEHIDNASVDSEYLTGQDEALESLIHQARVARGTVRSRDEIVRSAIDDHPTESPAP